jgi:hypothetical protein
MMNTVHKVLAVFGAIVLIISTAWGGASIGTLLAKWAHPDRVNGEVQFP